MAVNKEVTGVLFATATPTTVVLSDSKSVFFEYGLFTATDKSDIEALRGKAQYGIQEVGKRGEDATEAVIEKAVQRYRTQEALRRGEA